MTSQMQAERSIDCIAADYCQQIKDALKQRNILPEIGETVKLDSRGAYDCQVTLWRDGGDISIEFKLKYEIARDMAEHPSNYENGIRVGCAGIRVLPNNLMFASVDGFCIDNNPRSSLTAYTNANEEYANTRDNSQKLMGIATQFSRAFISAVKRKTDGGKFTHCLRTLLRMFPDGDYSQTDLVTSVRKKA